MGSGSAARAVRTSLMIRSHSNFFHSARASFVSSNTFPGPGTGFLAFVAHLVAYGLDASVVW